MIIYNTTFHIEKDIVTEALAYLKETYIPQATASRFLRQPRLCRIMGNEEDEGLSLSVQFSIKNCDTLNYWMEHEGRQIHQALVQRFGIQIAGFSTLLEEIDLDA